LRRTDTNGFVGETNVFQIAVGLGEYRDGFDPQFATGSQDAQSDFATIGDDNFVEHGFPLANYSMMNKG
jgi:hypothetical protein